MDATQLKARTKAFAIRIVKMAERLPRTHAGNAISRQIIRSATSVAANYRAACRGRSRAEFAAKLGIAEEEADETLFWLEMIGEAGLLRSEQLSSLMAEADELVAIMTASAKTARRRAQAT
ncbi:MAG: four helix bundle protein [Phycisphaerae bacterium]